MKTKHLFNISLVSPSKSGSDINFEKLKPLGRRGFYLSYRWGQSYGENGSDIGNQKGGAI